jgi:hypothetical protein
MSTVWGAERKARLYKAPPADLRSLAIDAHTAEIAAKQEISSMRGKPKRNNDLVPLTIRVPLALRQWLDDRARWSTGSMSSEAARVLRSAMDAERQQQRAAAKREAAAP